VSRDLAHLLLLQDGGSRVLRFPAWTLRTRPADVAAQVRAALLAAGWTGRL